MKSANNKNSSKRKEASTKPKLKTMPNWIGRSLRPRDKPHERGTKYNAAKLIGTTLAARYVVVYVCSGAPNIISIA